MGRFHRRQRDGFSARGRGGLILVEYGAKEAACVLPEPMTDVLTGRAFSGRVALKPYEVLVLRA